MRVAGRRLRVALPLLARKPEGRRARRALRILRQLRTAAGTSRDLDVGVALFEERLPGARRARPRGRTPAAAPARRAARAAGAAWPTPCSTWRSPGCAATCAAGGAAGRGPLHGGAAAARHARGARGARCSPRWPRSARATTPTRCTSSASARGAALHGGDERGAEGHAGRGPALFKACRSSSARSTTASSFRSGWAGRPRPRARGPEALAAEAAAQQAWFLEQSRAQHRAFLEAGVPPTRARGLVAMGAGGAAGEARGPGIQGQ